MTQSSSFTNRAGETFLIQIETAIQPEQANYWGYVISIQDSHGNGIVFRCIVRKSYLAQQSYADQFVLGDPMNYVKSLLEEYANRTTPLYWPSAISDWFVI